MDESIMYERIKFLSGLATISAGEVPVQAWMKIVENYCVQAKVNRIPIFEHFSQYMKGVPFSSVPRGHVSFDVGIGMQTSVLAARVTNPHHWNTVERLEEHLLFLADGKGEQGTHWALWAMRQKRECVDEPFRTVQSYVYGLSEARLSEVDGRFPWRAYLGYINNTASMYANSLTLTLNEVRRIEKEIAAMQERVA